MTLILTMILVISESVILYLDRFDKVQNQMCPECHSITAHIIQLRVRAQSEA